MSHQGATGSRSEKILRFDLVDTYAAIPVLGEKHEVASVGIEKEAGDPRCGFGIGKVAKRCGRSAEIDREVGFCERLIDGGALVAGIEYVCDNGFAAVFVEDGIEQSALSLCFRPAYHIVGLDLPHEIVRQQHVVVDDSPSTKPGPGGIRHDMRADRACTNPHELKIAFGGVS